MTPTCSHMPVSSTETDWDTRKTKDSDWLGTATLRVTTGLAGHGQRVNSRERETLCAELEWWSRWCIDGKNRLAAGGQTLQFVSPTRKKLVTCTHNHKLEYLSLRRTPVGSCSAKSFLGQFSDRPNHPTKGTQAFQLPVTEPEHQSRDLHSFAFCTATRLEQQDQGVLRARHNSM